MYVFGGSSGTSLSKQKKSEGSEEKSLMDSQERADTATTIYYRSGSSLHDPR